MTYKDYQKSRDAVWEILIKEEICELPIMIIQLCEKMGIVVKYDYDIPKGVDGYSRIIKGVPHIFLDPLAMPQRKKFTAAHELGHIILEHVGEYGPIHRRHGCKDDPDEQEANVFASRLLAPACVLWGCGVRTKHDIMELCQISESAAQFRMERMKILYQRDKFLTSPLERQVYKQFYPYIQENQIKSHPLHQASD